MKKIFITLVLAYCFSLQADSYYEKLGIKTGVMKELYNQLIDNYIDNNFSSDFIENYIKASEEYVETILNKSYFYIEKVIDIPYMADRVVKVGGNRFILTCFDYFVLIEISDNNIKEIFRSGDIGTIYDINVIDMDYDGQPEVVLLTSRGFYSYNYHNNKMEFGYRTFNEYGLDSIYKLDLAGRNHRIAGMVIQEKDAVTGTWQNFLYFFNWIFPGMDRREKIFENPVEGMLFFMDLTNDGNSEIIQIDEIMGKNQLSVYKKNLNGNYVFDKKSELVDINILQASNFREKIYILTPSGIFNAEYNAENLIIERNFFNINGSVFFDVISEDYLCVLTLERKIYFLKKLN